MNAWHWFKIWSTNPLEKYTKRMKNSVFTLRVTRVSSLLKEQAVSGMGSGAPRDLCCMTYVFHYSSFSNISSGLVASQSAWEGGLGPPEIDLFLRPNCLLNIIDHQSCHREEGVGKGAVTCTAEKGSFLWKAIYLKNVLVRGWTGRQKIGHISTTNTTTLGGCRIN